MAPQVRRYCSIEESIKESLRQIKLIREGKMPKKAWEGLVEEIEGIRDKGQGSLCSKRKRNKSR